MEIVMTDDELQRFAHNELRRIKDEADKDWIIDWMVFCIIAVVIAVVILTQWLILAWIEYK
jgi:hypothetical protein